MNPILLNTTENENKIHTYKLTFVIEMPYYFHNSLKNTYMSGRYSDRTRKKYILIIKIIIK